MDEFTQIAASCAWPKLDWKRKVRNREEGYTPNCSERLKIDGEANLLGLKIEFAFSVKILQNGDVPQTQ